SPGQPRRGAGRPGGRRAGAPACRRGRCGSTPGGARGPRADDRGRAGPPTEWGLRMHVRIDDLDPTPAYEQLRRQLLALVRTGALETDDRVHTIRQLAADHTV